MSRTTLEPPAGGLGHGRAWPARSSEPLNAGAHSRRRDELSAVDGSDRPLMGNRVGPNRRRPRPPGAAGGCTQHSLPQRPVPPARPAHVADACGQWCVRPDRSPRSVPQFGYRTHRGVGCDSSATAVITARTSRPENGHPGGDARRSGSQANSGTGAPNGRGPTDPHQWTDEQVRRLAQAVRGPATRAASASPQGQAPPECRLCALAASELGREFEVDEPAILVTVLEHAVVLSRPTCQDVLVAPTTHVAHLSALAEDEQAQMLAALRKVTATLRVGEEERVALTAIKLPGSAGHLCIRAKLRPRGGSGYPKIGRPITDQSGGKPPVDQTGRPSHVRLGSFFA